MLYTLISDSHNYLSFEYDISQIERLVGEPDRENFDRLLHYSNVPIKLAKIYREPVSIKFQPTVKEDKSHQLPDIAVKSGRLFLNDNAFKILEPLIAQDGEFLDIVFNNNQVGKLFNPLQVVQPDPKVTKKNEWEDIVSLGFDTNDCKNYSIFRTAFNGYKNLYCQESVKQAIEDNKLIGLYITNDLANIFPEDRESVEKVN